MTSWLLYLVADPERALGRPFLSIVEAGVTGGATALQLRDKKSDLRETLLVGAEVARIARRHRVPFLVNDRVDVALALEADGVHVGTEDLPPVEARRLLAPPRRLGVSAGTVREAVAAERAGADYLGVGPVFVTSTKSDAGEPIGLDGLADIASAVGIPVVGIGGIHRGNAASVLKAGAVGIAVISALMEAADPESEARALREILEAAGERQ